MKVHQLIQLGTVLLMSALAPSVRLHAAQRRPNILFIYTDDQSHRTVGCYPEAFDWVRTPNIDRLAERGGIAAEVEKVVGELEGLA